MRQKEWSWILFYFGRCMGLLSVVPDTRMLRAEMESNEEYHERTVVAPSDAIWGRVSSSDCRSTGEVEGRSVLPGLVSEERCGEIVREALAGMASGCAPSRFTMSGSNVRETHASDLPETKRWLRDELLPSIAHLTGGCDVLYDALVLVYDAEFSETLGTRAMQPVHRDLSRCTLNVALNPAADYCGGGTRFEADGALVQLPQGSALLHPGHLRHAGAPTTAGRRCVLVAFLANRCLVDARDHARVFHARADAAKSAGDPREALRLARCGLALDPTDGEHRMQASNACFQLAEEEQGRTADFYKTLARRFASQAVAAFPNSAAARHALGRATLQSATTPQQAQQAADILHRTLRDHAAVLDPAQEAALLATLDIASRTAAFLERQQRRVALNAPPSPPSRRRHA